MSLTIAVVGSTGHVGGALSRLLLASGVRVRAIGRSAERLAGLAQQGAEPHVGAVEDARFLAGALRGVAAAFVMQPPDYGHPDPAARSDALSGAMAMALQVARVTHAVTLSSIGADLSEGNGPIAGLHRMEQRINAVPGLHVWHLRPGYFLENWLGNIELIRRSGINGSALAPELRIPMIATRDIAAVAARLLLRPDFTGRHTRELQGPADSTPATVTAALGDAIGLPELRYVQFSYPDFRGALTGAGFSPAAADLFVEMSRAFNEGLVRPREPRSPDTTTGTTVTEFATEIFAPAYRS